MGLFSSLAGSLITGGLGFLGSSKAADAQENTADQSAAVQRYMYDQSREDMGPYRDVGVSAINQMRDLQGLGAEGSRDTAMNSFYQDPGYQFRFDEGQRAVENSAAAKGGQLSGNTLRELAGFGQGMGSGEYGNYWNRLVGLSGTGQTATNQLGVLGANAGRGIGNANLAAGQARGSGYIGMADALGSGVAGMSQAMGYGNQGSNWGGGYGAVSPNYLTSATGATYNTNPFSQQSMMLANQWS